MSQTRKTRDDMRVSSEEEFTDLLVFAKRSRRPNTKQASWQAQRTCTFSQNIRIVKFVSSRETTRAPCRNPTRPLKRANLVWQHRYAVWVQDLYSYWIQSYPTKYKAAQDNEMIANVRSPRSETRYCSYH